MMNKSIAVLIVSILLLHMNFYAQTNLEKRIGEVSYKSSQNIYVKFENTEGISAGDTLFIEQGNKKIPILSVLYISSKSCAGRFINGKDVAVGDKLTAFIDHKEIIMADSTSANIEKIISGNEQPKLKSKKESVFLTGKPDFTGRFSIQSYTNLSNAENYSDFQRWRYSFSFKANEIAGSAFSFTSYFIFTYRADDWQNVKESLGKGLKVYDLALSYTIDKTSILWFGRHLNRRISSINSIDGIQYEKSLENYFTGLIIGSRPNFSDLGFNIKLFEYGLFFGRSDTINSGIMENTFAVFQQTNNSITDRRFIYFQHVSTIIKNTSLFASSEIDLYKKESGTAKNKLTLTSLFISGRYSPVKLISFSLSYDARKNVIYYETFKNFADSILENETRQGLRAGINLKPISNLFIRLDGGYRFRKNDPKPSKNFTGSISYSNVPFIEAAPSISYSKLNSSYLNGNIWGARISKTFFSGNLTGSLNYRLTDYSLTYGSGSLKQSSIILDMGFRILSKLFLNISYESAFENRNSYSRVLADISMHF